MKPMFSSFTEKRESMHEAPQAASARAESKAEPKPVSAPPAHKASSSAAPTIGNEGTLDKKLVDVFCGTFGVKYRGLLTPETDMDAVEQWDSLSFLDLVFALEAAYGVTFTEGESAQMFQLGHIQRILRNAILEQPHDDLAHACCQLQLLRKAPDSQYKILILSGSSTREGFVTPSQGLSLLRAMSGRTEVGWYNISVSGLVAAETLQLLELIGRFENGLIVVGYSPIILGGCGEPEFRRAATHERFPFSAPRMDEALAEAGYPGTTNDQRPSVPLDTWVDRYLKDRSLEELQYEPYLYPTLDPWPAEKYSDEESILRFYNGSILNYEESIRINTQLFRIILEECRRRSVRVSLIELTLHSGTRAYLERLGRVLSRTEDILAGLRAKYGIEFIQAARDAGITDADFRDPAHVFRKRTKYTKAAIAGFLRIMPPS